MMGSYQHLNGPPAPPPGAPGAVPSPRSISWGIAGGGSTIEVTPKQERIFHVIHKERYVEHLLPPALPNILQKAQDHLSQIVKFFAEPRNQNKLFSAGDLLRELLEMKNMPIDMQDQTQANAYQQFVQGTMAAYAHWCNLMHRQGHSGASRRIRELEQKFSAYGWHAFQLTAR